MSAMASSTSFEDRLERARRYLAPLVGLPEHPDPIADQVYAAASEAHTIVGVMATCAHATDPGRGWRMTATGWGGAPLPDPDQLVEIGARTMVALENCSYCTHLRSGGPQPAWAFLDLHRVSCRRCAQTFRHPPADEADLCNWCGGRGVRRFSEIVLQNGPLLIIGNACSTCAGALRLDGAA